MGSSNPKSRRLIVVSAPLRYDTLYYTTLHYIHDSETNHQDNKVDCIRGFKIEYWRRMPPKEAEQVLSKQGEPIDEGDHVYTKIRGGRHEGDVSYVSFAYALCSGLA